MTNGTVIEYGELPDLGVGIFLFVLSTASFVLYALVARSVLTISRWNAPFILIIGQVSCKLNVKDLESHGYSSQMSGVGSGSTKRIYPRSHVRAQDVRYRAFPYPNVQQNTGLAEACA